MQDELKAKQEQKLQFKVEDCDWHIVDTLAILDLHQDERMRDLVSTLTKAHNIIKELKEKKYAKPKKMNDDTRERIVAHLKQTYLDQSFGDGMEEDYVLHGGTFDGLYNISDEQLLDEFKQTVYFGEGSDEEKLHDTAVAEMELNNAIDSE